ncbi:MAG: DUF799 family lipoprotein [Magnetococcales bacterium]|nr:DUF799 family lipoprotein [Magnetococcales bacterium]
MVSRRQAGLVAVGVVLSLWTNVLRAEESSFDLLDPEITMDATFKAQAESRPKRVAILPFANASEHPEAAALVRRAIYNHFSSLAYGDIELAETDLRLQRAGLSLENNFQSNSNSRLADTLKSDAVIRGKVTSYSRLFAVIASTVEVGAEVELVRLQDGKVLWQGKQTARSINGGLPTSPLDLVASVFFSAANMREQVVYRVVDQLARELVAKLPEPPVSNVTRLPHIKTVLHNSANLPRRAGDLLEVALEGDAGLLASFDIGGFKKSLPMEEVSAGVYRGRYQVKNGDKAEKETLIFHLKNDAQQQAEWHDFQGVVTFDTTPPKAPSQLTVREMASKVALRWQDGGEKDLAGFVVYRSDKPLSGFQKVGQVEQNAYTDSQVKVNITSYYKVMALDQAGNGSEFSQTLSATPVVAGPTVVKEDVQEDTIWRRGASPYLVEQSVIVERGVHWQVEPGVEIILSPQVGITVKGRMTLVGSKEEPVVMRGKNWQGILVDQSQKDNRIAHLVMSDSQLGLVINDAKVTMESLRLKGNGTGITITEGSKAVLKNSVISHNQGVGISLAGASATLLANTISHNGSFGLVIKRGMPEIRENHFENNQYFDLVAINEGGSPLNLSDNGWGGCDPFHVWERIVARHTRTSCLKPSGEKIKSGGAILDKPGKLQGKPSVAAAYEKYQEKDFQGAWAILSADNEKDSSALGNYLFARLLAPAGNMQAALNHFKKAVTLDGEQPGYGYWLGIHYLRLGEVNNARREWEKIVEQGDHQPSQRMLRLLR